MFDSKNSGCTEYLVGLWLQGTHDNLACSVGRDYDQEPDLADTDSNFLEKQQRMDILISYYNLENELWE